MSRTIQIPDVFGDYLEDWYYETYVVLGGYGSGKSYATALKIILKLLSEKRKCLVIREVFDTIKESCYDLFVEILDVLDLLEDEENSRKSIKRRKKCVAKKSPLSIEFPNGSRIIFKGMDKPQKLKSINGVSIVWFEEASEVKYEGYKEVLGRVRTKDQSMHFFLTFNPVGKENWTFRHFFVRLDDDGNEDTVLDEEELYKRRTIIKNGVYYHHSVPLDNPFLPIEYIQRLNEIKTYDESLYRVAKEGRFGANGTRVLPQFYIAENPDLFKQIIKGIPRNMHFIGMDFGFEESYNAVVSMAVDDKNKVLYIYDEIYQNHITDDKFALNPKMQRIKADDRLIVADNEDPKAIQYYRQQGFKMRSCRNKFAGSRLSNTRKIKRFKKIICSPKCKNTIRELRDLTYAKDAKGNVIYDEFNIDPHTFSAIWYALDSYNVADIKEKKFNSKTGNERNKPL